MARTIVEKIWDNHVVAQQAGAPALLFIDLHLCHEVTSPQAFQELRDRGLKVRRPDLTIATMDHSTPTTSRDLPVLDKNGAAQLAQMEKNCADFGIRLYNRMSDHQGIVTSQVGHVLASQCLLQQPSKTYEIRVDGQLRPGVAAKDIILAVIAKIGIGGGTECVFEFTGSAIRGLSMEERMTICNMSIEGGARAGLVAPDDTTYQYIAGREFAPKGAAWDAAVARWKQLPTDEGATYAHRLVLDASTLEQMVTFGTNPGMGIPVSGSIPDPASMSDAGQKADLIKALKYMDLQPGKPMAGHKIDVVFVGSCTNSRISDLRAAAAVIKGRKVSPNVRMLVVPGSQQVKKQAEAEGLDKIFREAGADFREAGCSMCLAMNGDELSPGQYSVSTSNRNFEGRQGKGGRTFLASPQTAAACRTPGRH